MAGELRGIHDRERTLEIIETCLDFYQEHCRHGERFGEILERMGVGELTRKVESGPKIETT